MSYFIANQISFNKKNNTFKVKGGDNNVIPRSSEWSNEIPLESLFFEFQSNDIQYNGITNIKLMKILYYGSKYYKKFINFLQANLGKNIQIKYPFFSEFNLNFLEYKDGNKLNINDFQKKEIQEGLIKINNEFIETILNKDEYEDKEYYVKLDDGNGPYIVKYKGIWNIKSSYFDKKSFKYFTALKLLEDISERNPILEEIE